MSQTPVNSLNQPSERVNQVSEKSKKKQNSGKSFQIATPSLELFQREDDSASHSVRARLTLLGLDYILRNVPLGDALKNEHLAKVSGKVEVPFFIDHRTGTKLSGSSAVLLYLDHEYGKKEKKRPSLRIARQINSRIQSNADELAWAVKVPVEQLQKVQNDAREAVRLLGKSVDVLRKAWKKSKSSSAA